MKINIKYLLPRFSRENDFDAQLNEINGFHIIANVLIWTVLFFFLLFLLKYRLDAIAVSNFIKWYGLIASIAGTVWVGAGVYYRPPVKKFDTVDALQRHVSATFKSASDHCVMGIFLFLFGSLLLVVSDEEYIVALDRKPTELHFICGQETIAAVNATSKDKLEKKGGERVALSCQVDEARR